MAKVIKFWINRRAEILTCECANECGELPDEDVTYEELAAAMCADARGNVAEPHYDFYGVYDRDNETPYMESFEASTPEYQHILLAGIIEARNAKAGIGTNRIIHNFTMANFADNLLANWKF